MLSVFQKEVTLYLGRRIRHHRLSCLANEQALIDLSEESLCAAHLGREVAVELAVLSP